MSKPISPSNRGHVQHSASAFPASELRRIIVCFLFDGSEKYTKMTLDAVNTFINATPVIPVGLLFPAHFEPEGITRQISDPTRIHVRRYENHFQNWNPTQYKLDIKKFAPEFTTVFWMDSDTMTYKDLTSLLHEFHVSPCKVAFLKDHVCWNPQFALNWVGKKNSFVPQACFMGFKAEIIEEFFGLWENLWRAWIEPAPFANFANPVPSFPGSAFCTEQYALGMLLDSDLIRPEEIYEIRRITFGLRVNAPDTLFNTSSSSISSFSSGLFGLESSFSSFGLDSSWNGSWSSSAETSWSTSGFFSSSIPMFSASNLMSFSGSAPTSGLFFSSGFPLSSGFSFSSGSSFSGSFSGSFDYDSSAMASFSSSGSSFNGSYSNERFGFIPVDNIGGGIVHFYNAFYEQSANWWRGNNPDVIPHLDQYWKSGSANFQ